MFNKAHDTDLNCDEELFSVIKLRKYHFWQMVKIKLNNSEKDWSTSSRHINSRSHPSTWQLYKPLSSTTKNFIEQSTFLVVERQTAGHQGQVYGSHGGKQCWGFFLSPFLPSTSLDHLAELVLKSTIEKALIIQCNIHVRLCRPASCWGVYRASVFLNKLPLRVAINPLLWRFSVSLGLCQC